MIQPIKNNTVKSIILLTVTPGKDLMNMSFLSVQMLTNFEEGKRLTRLSQVVKFCIKC